MVRQNDISGTMNILSTGRIRIKVMKRMEIFPKEYGFVNNANHNIS